MQPLPSERRYERLLASITDYAIYMTDVDGFITTWNDGARRIKGYNAVEIIGQHFSRFFTPDDVGRGLPGNILRAAREHGRHEEEGWRVRKDGSRFWANAVTQAVADEQGRLVGFAMITRDITERRAAQDALQRSEHRFRLLVDGMIDHAMYLLDPSGIVTSWNAGAERMKGYTPEEIVGHHFSLFYTPEDRASGLPARVLDIAAREGHYEADGWRVRKDGSRFWANTVVDAIRTEDGRLEGFAKITRDISERRAAQEALRQSERQFRLLVQNLTDYSLFMLDPNGIVTSWNAGAQRIKGYAAHEIIGRHFSQFYTDRDRAAGLPARALHRAMEEGRYEAEGWRVRKDGSLFWANVVIDRILDEKGALVGFAKITRDITERRSTQLALDEAQSQRAYAQKMDALGQLTGSVAHDFNNLLMIVSGHLARLRRAGDEARARQSAEAIEMAVRRGASLTRQLLSFSRRQPFDPTVIDLPSRIESVRAMLSSSTGSKIALAIGIPPGAWPIKVDASEFDLALVNLTLNARDAMPEGGSITISSENVTLAPADTPARLEGEFVAVRVTDSGTGIPPDILSKVFDPFFTTKDSTKGSGLGLSQVYGFAQQSGGTVTIDSELGRGTTVTLYLPRARHEAAEERRSEETPVADGRILLVEDNPAVADASSSLLEQLGYSVVQVRDAAAALQAAGDAEFDLVVSDIMMPGGMDGLALAHVLRERQPGLPILLMTGYHQLADEAGREFVLLRKPFDLSDLSRATTRARSVARATGDTNVIALPVGPRAPR